MTRFQYIGTLVLASALGASLLLNVSQHSYTKRWAAKAGTSIGKHNQCLARLKLYGYESDADLPKKAEAKPR